MAEPLVLRVGRRQVDTVFDLLGRAENDLTYSLGWALVRSPALLKGLAGRLGLEAPGLPVSVELQQSATGGGITDVEVRWQNTHVILEAKRGWTLPTPAQLRRYRTRLDVTVPGLLVAVGEGSEAWAVPRLPADVDGVPVSYVSWEDIIGLTRTAARSAKHHAEQRLLRELIAYLRGAVRVQDLTSNETYCVVIGPTRTGWSTSFREVVDSGQYFHAYGVKGWPTTPPNYLAFRWENKVQRIHHVDSYEIIDGLHDRFPGVPASEGNGPHMLYQLGPKIGPVEPLPAGTTYRASRLWVALDLLLTAPTLKDAIAATKARQNG